MSSDIFAPTAFPSLSVGVPSAQSERAHAAGYAAGYAEGARLARDELARLRHELEAEHAVALHRDSERLDRVIDVLNTALRSALETVVPVIAESQDALARAALDLAAVVVGCELESSERSAASVVARVLEHPDLDTALSVHLSTADLEALDPAVLERVQATVVPDPALGRGDGIVQFSDGYLDARIGAALSRARAALLEETP